MTGNISVTSIIIFGGQKYEDSKNYSGCKCSEINQNLDQSTLLMFAALKNQTEGTYILPVNKTDTNGIDVNYVLSYDKNIKSEVQVPLTR
jgi:hypothetical protein